MQYNHICHFVFNRVDFLIRILLESSKYHISNVNKFYVSRFTFLATFIRFSKSSQYH